MQGRFTVSLNCILPTPLTSEERSLTSEERSLISEERSLTSALGSGWMHHRRRFGRWCMESSYISIHQVRPLNYRYAYKADLKSAHYPPPYGRAG